MGNALRITFELLFLSLFVLIGSPAYAEDAAALQEAELKQLAGKWEFVSITVSGERREPSDEERKSPLVIDGRNMSTQNIKLTFTIDPATDPKVIDLTLDVDGQPAFEGIYKLDDDKFVICINAEPGAKERPAKFVSEPGSNLTLVEFKRIK